MAKDEPPKIRQHLLDALEHSMDMQVNMETSLAIQLAQAHTALRSARAALQTAPKGVLRHAAVQATLAVLEDAIP